VKVKICGITNYTDAMLAVDAGADALGFVFYNKSPRFISPQNAKAIISKLPPFIEKVGLFVKESPHKIEETAHYCNITLAQIHFDINETFLNSINFPVLPVVRARCVNDLEKFADRYRLIDAYSETYGGSGKRLNLEWFKKTDNSKTIIAGGLNAKNVLQLAQYGFYGVDVSSGVEEKKGIKDPKKVKEFISNAKSF